MALLSTVAENERLHSVRDVSRAKEARSLTRRLGFPPSQSLARMLNSGSIIDCPVTSRDVILSDSIYGPAEPSVKGRTTNRAGQDNRTWEPTEVVEKPILEMHTDIMYLSGMPFLLSVFTPIDLTSVTNLKGSRNHPNIRAGLDEQLNAVERAGLTVAAINCDGEFDADQVQGLMTNRNPSQHLRTRGTRSSS